MNVFDFEAVARQRLPPTHLGYMDTGTDDNETLEANREAFNRLQLRVRRLVDVRQIDMSVTLVGTLGRRPSSWRRWAACARSILMANEPRRAVLREVGDEVEIRSLLRLGSVDQPACLRDECLGLRDHLRGLGYREHRAGRVICVFAIALHARDQARVPCGEPARAHEMLTEQRDHGFVATRLQANREQQRRRGMEHRVIRT